MKKFYCLFLFVLSMMLLCPNRSLAYETASAETELMNEIDGIVTICLPEEKPQERFLKYIDDFFKVYKLDDELKEFVLQLQKDFGDEDAVDNPLDDSNSTERTFDEVMADPMFEAFEKVVKIYDVPAHRSIDYNISKFYNLKPSSCKFAGDKYLSGGLQVEVRGYKANNDPKDLTYILVDKNAELVHQKIPLPNSYSTSKVNLTDDGYYYNFSKLNNDYRSFIDDDYKLDCSLTRGTNKKADFFKENNLNYARILKNDIFSMKLEIPFALNYKLNDGKSFSNVSIEPSFNPPLLDFRLSRFMYCSPELHLKGFCNMDIPGKKSALESSNFFMSQVDPAKGNKYNYKTTDQIFLNFDGLRAGLTSQIISKTGGANPHAELQVQGKTYDGLIVIGNFNLTKGNKLASPSIVNYPQSVYAKDLVYASISDDEIKAFTDTIFVTSMMDRQKNEDGTVFLKWLPPTLIEQGPYYKYSASGGYKVFRDGVEIAHLSSAITSYTDEQFPTLETGIHKYLIAPVNSLGEYLFSTDISTTSIAKTAN